MTQQTPTRVQTNEAQCFYALIDKAESLIILSTPGHLLNKLR